MSVYYVSKSLVGTKVRYSVLEKLVYSLIRVATKLRPYFELPTIYVITYFPMMSIMRRSKVVRTHDEVDDPARGIQH